jgi:hypothetical protein
MPSYLELESDEGKNFDRLFQLENSMIEVNPGNVIMPTLFRQIGDDIVDLPIRESDVWLCSFPRTGKSFIHSFGVHSHYQFSLDRFHLGSGDDLADRSRFGLREG